MIKTIQSTKLRRPACVFRFKYFVNIERASFLRIYLLRSVKMNLITYLVTLKVFLSRSEIKIMIVSTAAGGVLQILAKSYLKNHPELLKDSPESKDSPKLKEILLRGGEILVTSASVEAILSFLAQHGLTAGAISGTSLAISRIPVKAISTCLYESMVQNLSHLEKKKFSLVEGSEIHFNQCDGNLKYLFDILEDETIPFKER